MTEISTQTLGVNAAFLSEIKEDHVELRQLLAQARQSVDASLGKDCARRIYHLLLAIQDRLAIHFSLEEAYGYCEDALAIAPRLSVRAHALRNEHQALYVEFGRIVEFAEQLVYHERPNDVGQRLATRFRKFDLQLGEHERLEMELILEAFNDDEGDGD
jgi:hypothetical protein